MAGGLKIRRPQRRDLPAVVVLLLALVPDVATDTLVGQSIDFNSDVRPIFNRHCIACHGGVRQMAGLSFVYKERALVEAESGALVVSPGKPENSYLIARVEADDDERMPPAEHGPRLSSDEVGTLRRWIAEGAVWDEHWSFRPLRDTAPPTVGRDEWCQDPLDHFVLARLESEGIHPSVEADRLEWLRRVTFDLIGLPPTVAEIDAFRIDNSPRAYETVVDRLLQSASFGERWAVLWLDLARYADSQGYEKDNLRTMWPYRDWIIRAFNADMPFDQFTVRQLAGDLLPDASLDDIIATAFHRNTPTNTEGGTDDEEFRIAAVIDRVNTTWEVWQGLTFKCVQCHAHPYAPFEHREYYEFLAFFNTSQDWDLSNDVPKLSVPEDRQHFARARAIDSRIRALRQEELAAAQQQAGQTIWHPLKPTRFESTGQTELVLKDVPQGSTDIVTKGTVSHGSRFTLEFPVPTGVTQLTALRVDVLPRKLDVALSSPELGFVISELKAEIPFDESLNTETVSKSKSAALTETSGDEKKEEPPTGTPIVFSVALGDEVEPFGDPQATLKEDKDGWGAKPRITHARRLIVVAESPVKLDSNKPLRLSIRQEDAPNDMMPLVMNRSRYSIAVTDDWQRLTASESFRARRSELETLLKERRAMKTAPLPVMVEQDSSLQRVAALFSQGNWLSKGESVSVGIPGVFGSLPGHASGDRLALARWLVGDGNPLTARVAVNRFWEQLFGVGLVETLEDFGPSGERPSHPELLDFLALRFRRDLGWSVKGLLGELVLSATYRQAARVRPELVDGDPQNRLLARGPRGRLTAEMVRDNALAVAGLLSAKMFGPSVMPAQPEGLGRAARSGVKWETSEGEDRYRRAVYTLIRRSNVYPSMVTFDAPNRLVCTARRFTTNTPLQALATLNDPVHFEAAVALACRMVESGVSNPQAQIKIGYRLATGRVPATAAMADLVTLYDDALEEYQADELLRKNVAETPEHAALALVANAILNLDRVLTK